MTYWEHRARLNQAAYDRANNRVARQVAEAYERTMRQLDEDIRTIIDTYQRKTGLSVREAWEYLREGVPESVMQDLLSRVAVIQDPRERNRLEVMLRTDRYRGRISRLDAIKASTRVGMTEAAEVELGALTPHLEGVGRLAYSRTMFDIQKATAGFQSVGVPRLGTILKKNWSGQHYSRAVWANRDTMSGMLDRAMMEMASMGKLSDLTMRDVRGLVDLDKWRKQLTTKFRDEQQYAKYAANRLIRTESAYVANQATAEAFEQAEIEKYAFVSVLDGRTSQICGDLDGKIFDLADKEVGVNYPPMHPHCRSHTAPIIDGLVREGLMRRGRDANGKSVLLPRDMNHAEWKRWQDDGAPGDVEAWREKSLLNNPIKNVIINNEERVSFPYLKRTTTGEFAETEVVKIDNKAELKQYTEKAGWNVDWAKMPTDVEVFGLRVKNETKLQGIVGLRNDVKQQAVYIQWASTAPQNNKAISGGNQEFIGVGGNLFAIAAEKSLQLGHGGFVYGYASNKKVLEHYVEKFDAQYVGQLHQWHFIIDENAAQRLMDKYNYGK